jgi:hypothetical protein
MKEFVFKPPLRLTRGVEVRTLNHAAEFASNYVGAKSARRRERVVELLQAATGYENERAAANDFRAWAEAEGLLDRQD